MSTAPSIAQLFDQFAKKAAADFPELSKEFAVYYVPEDSLHGHFDPAQEEELKNIGRARVEEGLAYELDGAALPPATGGQGHYMIEWFNTINDTITFKAPDVLRHELAHLVAPGAGADRTGETTADVFAALYEPNPDNAASFMETSQQNGAAGLILCGDVAHFTTPGLLALDDLASRHDIRAMNLSPIETANLAYRVSIFSAPKDETLDAIIETFAPVKDAFLNNERGRALDECRRIMETAEGDDARLIYATAKAFMTVNILNMPLMEETQKDLLQQLPARPDLFAAPTLTRDEALARDARDQMVLGRFDQNPGTRIDPMVYEAHPNLVHLQRKTDAYIKTRKAVSAPRKAAAKITQKKI